MSSKTAHGVFCNRTLNLRSIRAIGYDLDYTLVHYHMIEWEGRAYAYIREGLLAKGWPVGELHFDDQLAVRGLIVDTQLGNIVKANRFGYVKRAYHGTKPMDYDEQRRHYGRTIVDLRESRWIFLNTLFSISAACMYMQLVDLKDQNLLPLVVDYDKLYQRVQKVLDEAHAEGKLKAEILADPGRFIDLDPELVMALRDQKAAGKTLLLITNSEWEYAAPILSFAFDRYLPEGQTWRDLFQISFFNARKPDFFSGRAPAYRIVDENGLLKEHRGPLQPGLYMGGNAALVEAGLGLDGSDILYVGDHIWTDVNVAKSVLRWRTALIIRELEDEITAAASFNARQDELSALMAKKEAVEAAIATERLHLLRAKSGHGPAIKTQHEAEVALNALRDETQQLDLAISPIAQAANELLNPHWGPLLRTGNDKSHLARQIERYADVYMSRVANFIHITPYAFLNSHRGSLPHD